jgi:lipopolysaccharide transport protein LptA
LSKSKGKDVGPPTAREGKRKVRKWQIDLFHGMSVLLVVAMAVLSLCPAAWTASEDVADEAPSKTPDKTTKTVVYDIDAKSVNVSRKTGVTVFEGDAKLKVLDSEDFLNADKITVYKDVETDEVIKIESVGNVDMNQRGMKATCERSIFYEKEDRIELEGSEEKLAVIDDGYNRIEAPFIIYFRKEDRISASGGVKARVTIEVKEVEVTEESTEEPAEKPAEEATEEKAVEEKDK